jgi:hypothetical protein
LVSEWVLPGRRRPTAERCPVPLKFFDAYGREMAVLGVMHSCLDGDDAELPKFFIDGVAERCDGVIDHQERYGWLDPMQEAVARR